MRDTDIGSLAHIMQLHIYLATQFTVEWIQPEKASSSDPQDTFIEILSVTDKLKMLC